MFHVLLIIYTQELLKLSSEFHDMHSPSRTTAKTFVERELHQNLPSKILLLNLAATRPIITSSSLVTRERAPWTQQTPACAGISANGGIRAGRVGLRWGSL